MVGVRGFEPLAPAPQTQCSSQAELHTENLYLSVTTFAAHGHVLRLALRSPVTELKYFCFNTVAELFLNTS